MTLRFVAQHARDVLADQQPGHADVAAEVLVVDRDDPHVVAPEAVDERLRAPGRRTRR